MNLRTAAERATVDDYPLVGLAAGTVMLLLGLLLVRNLRNGGGHGQWGPTTGVYGGMPKFGAVVFILAGTGAVLSSLVSLLSR